MHTSTVFSILTAFTTASAAKAYIPWVWNNTAPSVDGLPVQARGNDFWIGGDAATVCPSYDPDCPSTNRTIITGPTASRYSSNLDAFWMGVLSPQGQEMITTDGGHFGYTIANTNLSIGSGLAINTPFAVDFDDFSNQTVLRFDGNDFVGCPIYGALVIKPLSSPRAYEFATGPCFPFKMRLEETHAPAVEYYD